MESSLNDVETENERRRRALALGDPRGLVRFGPLDFAPHGRPHLSKQLLRGVAAPRRSGPDVDVVFASKHKFDQSKIALNALRAGFHRMPIRLR